MTVAERLGELGLTLPLPSAPVGSYVPAVHSGNHVWTSGQLPFVDGVLPVTGKVGVVAVSLDEAARQARVAALNAVAAVANLLAAETGDSPLAALERVVRVVKVVGFVASETTFFAQPAVINGASDLLGALFPEPHARSAVGVAALPLDSPVEVEIVVEVA